MTRSAGAVDSLTGAPRCSRRRPARRAGACPSSCHSGNGAARSAVPLPNVGKITMSIKNDRRRRMGLFDRLRGGGRGGGNRRGTLDRGSHQGDLSHLEQFVATRRGVEGYVEPRTSVTETTIVLVAADGEWTRRRINGPEVARKLSRDLAIPV